MEFLRLTAKLGPMIIIAATIQNEHGIHCRPSAMIIRSIADYPGTIEVHCEHGSANPRSMLALMSLGLSCGTPLTIQVDGPDEQTMADRLKELFETRFDFVREE
jgi:phosphotransferase system HPr (HPr) family protein